MQENGETGVKKEVRPEKQKEGSKMEDKIEGRVGSAFRALFLSGLTIT